MEMLIFVLDTLDRPDLWLMQDFLSSNSSTFSLLLILELFKLRFSSTYRKLERSRLVLILTEGARS